MRRATTGKRVLSGLALVLASVLAACGPGEESSIGGGGGNPPGQTGSIALFAGSLQRAGSQDGLGAAAQFNLPEGVAIDASGNVYVTDTGNHTVRRIAADGRVTTLAGVAGEAGSTDGRGNAARFSSPRGIALDNTGALYVADAGNHTVRRIATDGTVTTVAGVAGQPGAADGAAAAARLQTPSRVAVDGTTGSLFVVANGVLRKVAPGGAVSTFAQPVCASVAAVAVDSAGNVYVGDSAASGPFASTGCVRKLNNQGAVTPFGSAADGIVRVPFPVGLAVDGGNNVYVASNGSFQAGPSFTTTYASVQKIAPSGVVTVVAGVENDARAVDGTKAVARLIGPATVAVNAAGRIAFAEPNSASVRLIDAQGAVSTLAGGLGAGEVDGQGANARFSEPRGLAVATDGTLYVADARNRKVRKIATGGAVSTLSFTNADGTAGVFATTVHYLALDSLGTLFVSETGGVFTDPVSAIDTAGRRRLFTDNSPSVSALAAGPGNKIYLAQPTGVDSIDSTGSRVAVASGLTQAAGVAVDRNGRVYISDAVDHTVRTVSPQGEVTVLAGQSGSAGYADGPGAQAKLDGPRALTLDATGNLYVADGATIRKITPQGVVSTVAGAAGQTVPAPGALPGAVGRVNGLVWSGGMLYATVQNAVIRIGPLP